ncbi:MAG: hypothetical protein JSU86_06045 [Phycisphaerales bacterium]|nr:MAG: hypothetical protein JSU86_06045 [Phycisphaerales bacterium]
MSRPALPMLVSCACITLLCLAPACRRDEDVSQNGTAANDNPKKPPELLVFPSDLRTEDDSVNAFVKHAMTQCASGHYDKFRLLWSAREDPLPRSEYQQGWQAVQEIRIRALQKAMLSADPAHGREEDETVYVIVANVSLDPTHRAGQREANREVALMLVREHDSWRLARAPKKMRAWIKERVSGDSEVLPEPPNTPSPG